MILLCKRDRQPYLAHFSYRSKYGHDNIMHKVFMMIITNVSKVQVLESISKVSDISVFVYVILHPVVPCAVIGKPVSVLSSCPFLSIYLTSFFFFSYTYKSSTSLPFFSLFRMLDFVWCSDIIRLSSGVLKNFVCTAYFVGISRICGPGFAAVRGRTIKFANSPPCACRGSTGKEPQCGLMTLTYQRFKAVLLLIYGSLFPSGIYYCLRVFWCAAARVSELELEQRTNIKFLVKFGKSGNEIREILGKVYRDNAMKKTAVYKWVKHFF